MQILKFKYRKTRYVVYEKPRKNEFAVRGLGGYVAIFVSSRKNIHKHIKKISK